MSKPYKTPLSVLFLCLTCQVFAQFGYLTGNVTDKFGPIQGAIITMPGTPFGTLTDSRGYYSFQLDTGEYEILLQKVGYNSINERVIIRHFESSILNITMESIILEQGVESGSQSKKIIRQMDSSVPIDVITGEEITATNQPNLGLALHYLIPTFCYVDQTIADGSDFVSPASLRGLSPDQLLVLVNGKRLHQSGLVHVNGTFGRGSSGTDLSAIPMASIDRIEVLRYGVSTQYGSDAIAGVLDIVLKNGNVEPFIEGTIGGTQDGGGEVTKIAGNDGFGLGELGYLNFTFEFLNKNAVNRSGEYTGIIYGDNRDDDQQQRDLFFNNSGFSGKRIMEVGSPDIMNVNLTFNGSVNFGAEREIYFFSVLNSKQGSSNGFYRLPFDSTKVVHEFYPYGFSPEINPNITDISFVVGQRSHINGWLFDFKIDVGENIFQYDVANSINASLGINSPSLIYAGGFKNAVILTGFDMTKSYQSPIPIDFSLGVKYKQDRYVVMSGDEESYVNGMDTTLNGEPREIGFQVFPGFKPENAISRTRPSIAGYCEFKSDITPSLEFILGSRLESYFNTYGVNFVYRLTGRYKISKKFNLRGGYSSGFKAPSLHQLYYSKVSTQFVDGNVRRVATFNNESFLAASFKIPELKPELSRNINIGIASSPGRNLTSSIDFYRILITDRIVLSGQVSGSDDPAYDAILTPLNVNSAQFFTNAVSTVTSGIDCNTAYHLISNTSELLLSLGYNYSKTKVSRIKAEGLLNNEKDILFSREEVSRLESNVPLTKIILNAKYSRRKFSVNFRNTYFGRVKYVHPMDGNKTNWVINDNTGQIESRDQVFSPKIITDVDFTYQIWEELNISIGANNLLNVYPDKQTHSANIDDGRFIYSRRVRQFGVQGAYYFVKFIFKL